MKNKSPHEQLHKLFMDAHLQFRRRLTQLRKLEIAATQEDYAALKIMLKALIEARKRLERN